MSNIFSRHDLFQRDLFLDKLNFHGEKMHNVHYNDLVYLVNNSMLVPGMKYRIIDYITVTSQTNTRSAGKLFDVVVTALTENTLDESASCCTTNRTNSSLPSNETSLWHPEKWKIKYSIDVNTNTQYWANKTGHTGVIYWMQDEFGNEAPYDFKNIQYAAWKYINKTKLTYANVASFSDSNMSVCSTAASTTWRYTFNITTNYSVEQAKDGSLLRSYTGYKNCKIKTYTGHSRRGDLPVVMFNITDYADNVIVEGNCYNINIETLNDTANSVSISVSNLSNIKIFNVNNFYGLFGAFYSSEIINCTNCCFSSWGSSSNLCWCCTFRGKGNIMCCLSHFRDVLMCNNVIDCKMRGRCIQNCNFYEQVDSISWVCNDSVNGYFLNNTFLSGCANITFSPTNGWIFDSMFHSGYHYVTINASGTASFNTPVKNIELHGSNYGTASSYKSISVPVQGNRETDTSNYAYSIFKGKSKSELIY